MSNRRRLLLLPLFVLIAAAINMPFAVWCAQSPPPGTRPLAVVYLYQSPTGSAAAAAKPWPAATPHAHPWPTPTSYDVERIKFGARRIDCRSHVTINGVNHGLQMDCHEFGWPLPSIQRVQRWWPWTDPGWKLDAPQDVGFQIRWSGTILNPLMAGGGLWLLLIGLPSLWLIGRSRRRLRHGLCPACAYPFSSPDRCTECGLARRRSANPAATP
jgi:hypothetical protein